MKKKYLSAVAAIFAFGPFVANADLIDIEVVDATSINVSLSGVIAGPAPALAAGILFIDTPVPTSVQSFFSSITGDAMLGSSPIFSAFSGFNNGPYGGSLQLRTSLNGSVPLSIGDILSGTATILFSTPHGMTQSMFDGVGAPIYWGSFSDASGFGTLIGSSMTPATKVPEPGTLTLFGLGLLGLGLGRRKAA